MPRILIADDNPPSLQFFADTLTACGLEIVTAADGVEAVACAGAHRCDLLLLDVHMPRLDGSGALARIRAEADSPSRDARALATSAEMNADVRAQLLASGFADVLPKPIGIRALHAAVRQHLPGIPVPDAFVSEPQAPLSHPGFDERKALAVAGGDASIVAALRGLLRAELEGLPREFARIAANADRTALRDRLHRLAASAGLCGVPALTEAIGILRTALTVQPDWPQAAITEFIECCTVVRTKLQ